MALKHSNPTNPRFDKKNRSKQWANAPYNFIPLPEKMVAARPLFDQDSYEGLTGWIECQLETLSPTYVRGMLTEAELNQMEQELKELEQVEPDKMTDEEKKDWGIKKKAWEVRWKERHALFFATTEEEIAGCLKPVIPGSSLRGMVRALVEVVGYGRMRWVGPEPTFTFRAVAAPATDPLRDPYRAVVGAFARNVDAGYLKQDGDKWFVQPAYRPQDQGWAERGSFLKVKQKHITAGTITGFLPFDHKNHKPDWFQVSFDADNRPGKRGKYTAITAITDRRVTSKYRGVLVCSGNMLEVDKGTTKSPRKNHALILEENPKAKPIQIDNQAIKDYLAGLTVFQREELKAWGGEKGCLKSGVPVFYVTEGKKVVYFGHSPNFRIPARLSGSDRAATPFDFVPDKLQNNPNPDLVDAIFGWVEEEAHSLKNQRAGRVFFEDAHFVKAEDGVWVNSEPITPHILASPKPTTFQHYLVQDKNNGHDPDDKKSLAHYGTSPDETQIRGYKFYWIKGNNPDIKASAKEQEHQSQLTRIMPIKPDVHFSFKVRFDNLREEELGALLWALTLPGDPDKRYCHRIGMGKPFGMGAVTLTPHLHITERKDRYDKLFDTDIWYEAEETRDLETYVKVFEEFILKDNDIGSNPNQDRLADVERIQMLLTMLQWREDNAEWADQTRYMEIEHGPRKINEYKERPVLPDPFGVDGQKKLNKPSTTTTKPKTVPQPETRDSQKSQSRPKSKLSPPPAKQKTAYSTSQPSAPDASASKGREAELALIAERTAEEEARQEERRKAKAEKEARRKAKKKKKKKKK